MFQTSNILIELSQTAQSAYTTLANLAWHYVFNATPFFFLHLLLLFYFLNRWFRSRSYLGKSLKELRDNSQTPSLLTDAENQIKEYNGQGREFLVQRLENSIFDKLHRHTEPLRLLVNSFVVVGLMGTLFALFEMGAQQQGQQIKAQDIVNRMSIAFSASFFGLSLTLFCNLFLLKSLRVRVTEAIIEASRRLNALNVQYPANTPAHAVFEAVEEMKNHVRSSQDVMQRMEETEKKQLAAAHSLLEEFRATTLSILSSLISKISEAQQGIAQSADSLEEKITTTLGDLKTSFTEINENWKEERQQAIRASERASRRLGKSSQDLSNTTKEVSVSLMAVTNALNQTKQLAAIVNDIERLTNGYLRQTEEQMNLFHTNLRETAESVRSIPDEWFTMLHHRNEELTDNLRKVTNIWKEELVQIGNDFFTEFGKVDETLNSVSGFLAPTGALRTAVDELHTVATDSLKVTESKSMAPISERLDSFTETGNTLKTAVEELTNSIFSRGTGETVARDRTLIEQLDSKVTKTHEMLMELTQKNLQEASAPTVPYTDFNQKKRGIVNSSLTANTEASSRAQTQELPGHRGQELFGQNETSIVSTVIDNSYGKDSRPVLTPSGDNTKTPNTKGSRLFSRLRNIGFVKRLFNSQKG